MKNNDFWEEFFENTRSIFEEFKSAYEDYNNEKKDDSTEKEGNSSYYHFVSDKYENGEHVEHSEKIVDNGKMVKDECFSIDDNKDEKKAIGSDVIKEKNTEISELKDYNEKLRTEINKLKEENDKVKLENSKLKANISRIKNMLN